MHSLAIEVRRRLAVEHENAEVWPFEWHATTTDVAGGCPFAVAAGLGLVAEDDATAVFTCDVAKHARLDDRTVERLKSSVRLALVAAAGWEVS